MENKKIMKVIIADDENKVCNLINHLIEWEELDMEVVAIVDNGIDALKQIEIHKPHIVITDIRMPGCNGLEMISRAKKISEKISFIIISGFRNFEYAQNAIKYGVRDYILKPINKIELENILRVVRQRHIRKAQNDDKNQELLDAVKNNGRKIRESLLFDCMTDIGLKGKNLEELNTEYNYSFQPGLFQIIVIKLDGIVLDNDDKKEFINHRLNQYIDNNIREICYEYEKVLINTACYIVMNYSEINKKYIRKSYKTILDDIRLEKNIFKNITVTVGLGVVVECVDEINQSLETAKSAVQQKVILGANKVYKGKVKRPRDLTNTDMFIEYDKNIRTAVERLNQNSLISSINGLYEKIKQMEDLEGCEILSIYKEAVGTFIFTMRQNGLYLNDDSRIDLYNCEIIDDICNLDDLNIYIKRKILNLFSEMIEEKKHQDNRPIREAKKYISQYYYKKITLEKISNKIGFNATYFSTLFKKETGITFFDYLTKIRLEKAKEYLKETNENISFICEKVGYNDVKHFTKIFKKYTNLKPNEFRKIYS